MAWVKSFLFWKLDKRWRWIWVLLCFGPAIYLLVSFPRKMAVGRALKIAGAGRELEERGDIEQALQRYEEATRIEPRFAYGLALLGRAYHKLGDDDKAMEQYEKALKASPRHYWVHYLIGELYRDQGQYRDAIDKFEELVAMEDNRSNSNKILGYTEYQKAAWGKLGYCYAKVGDRQRAIKSYEQYLTRNPSATDRAEVSEYIKQLKGE